MSDFAIKTLAVVFWPVLVVLCAVVMAISVLLMFVAWPLVPFTRVVREGGKVKLKF